jgi:hypothetical protein
VELLEVNTLTGNAIHHENEKVYGVTVYIAVFIMKIRRKFAKVRAYDADAELSFVD